MQQPIRYYITKSGEEPTVRSVKVSRETTDAEDRDVKRSTDVAKTSQDKADRHQGVKSLVQGAIRKRILNS
jgi:hypothetical protein